MKKAHTCWDCGAVINIDRANFLIESGIRPEMLTCLKHSATTKIKGIYSGENGTSDIILCDKVYNDNVRSKFRETEDSIAEHPESEV